MAITREAFELLCWARARDERRWDKVLTLGRQAVVLPRWELPEWQRAAAQPIELADMALRVDDASAGEELIARLGARQVDSMDHSHYEGANVIHNLNEPVADGLVMAYDVVFDGGTLEHVFDYPRALANALRMVRPGGWFLAATPSNMWCGHGFYQLGPEVFRMALQPAFGFELDLLAFGLGGFRKEFWVCGASRLADSRRLGIFSRHPATLLVAGRRVNAQVPAEIRVEQSDYTARWKSDPARTPPAAARLPLWHRGAGRLASMLPLPLRGRVHWWLSRRQLVARLQDGLHPHPSLPR